MADSVGYPFRKYRYRVEVDGLVVAGFNEVSGFDAAIEAANYREGNGKAPASIKVPGIQKHGNVTLKCGLAGRELHEWMAGRIDGKVERKTVTITLMDDTGCEVASWKLVNAWPVKYTEPEFNTASGEVAVEALELAHEGITRAA